MSFQQTLFSGYVKNKISKPGLAVTCLHEEGGTDRFLGQLALKKPNFDFTGFVTREVGGVWVQEAVANTRLSCLRATRAAAQHPPYPDLRPSRAVHWSGSLCTGATLTFSQRTACSAAQRDSAAVSGSRQPGPLGSRRSAPQAARHRAARREPRSPPQNVRPGHWPSRGRSGPTEAARPRTHAR